MGTDLLDAAACRVFNTATMSDAGPVFVLVRDLILASRVTAEAASAGVTAKLIRDPKLLENEPARRLIVDLNLPGAIEAAAAWKRSTNGDVVGFVAHTDVETITKARASGIDRVLARSRFVELLPAILAGQDIGSVQ
jgi:hypothetical protein